MDRMTIKRFLFVCGAFACLFSSGCGRISDGQIAALQNANPIVRESVIREIAKSPSPVDRLFSTLDGSENERKAAVLLMGMLRKNKYPVDIQVIIIRALGELGRTQEAPVTALLEKINDRSRKVSNEAVISLGKTKRKQAAPALKKLLGGDVGDRQYPVIWALGEIGDVRSVAVLEDLLSSEDPYIRYHVRIALGKIGTGDGEGGVSQVSTGNGGSGNGSLAMRILGLYQDVMRAVFQRIAGHERA